MYVNVCLWGGGMHNNADVLRGQRRWLSSELKLQAVVNSLTWVGTGNRTQVIFKGSTTLRSHLSNPSFTMDIIFNLLSMLTPLSPQQKYRKLLQMTRIWVFLFCHVPLYSVFGILLLSLGILKLPFKHQQGFF